MLPDLDTPERARVEREALAVGQAALTSEHGNIPNALYRVYMTYRERFVRERGLEGGWQEQPREWQDALVDARQLEAYVNDTWRRRIAEECRASLT